MKLTASALLRALLLASVPIGAVAQTQPVIIEAETGTFGENLVIGTAGDVTYVTTNLNGTTPPTAGRIATYSVTFPAAGNYELYARYLVGPNAANDDSWYFGQGFGVKTPEVGAQWALQNEAGSGFTNPAATVVPGGTTGSNVFKWVKLTGSQGPAAWVVPADGLTQTFQWGSREDGMQMDKLAFGRAGVCYTVTNLNTAGNATGTCPPPPPPEPPAYTRTEPAIATGLPKYLGAAWSPGLASLNFVNYWNQVTPENGGKWGSVEGTRDVMNWAQADASYALAKANGYPFKWHAFIWGNQQPGWIESLSTAEQAEEIREWYAAVAERYPDIDQIEVVNEPLHDPPRGPTNGNYIEALGGNGVTGWDWVINAFVLAREYFPNSELILNDYSISNDGNATTNYINIINLLKERGLIDAIGDQAHAFSTTEAAPMNNHKANLTRLQATGLPIYATELDIDGVLTGVINDEVQVASFKRIFPTFWEHPGVKGVTIWGYVRGFHWRNAQGDWLLYQNGGERPAMQWLIRYVQNKQGEVTPGQVLSVNESTASGAVFGTVVATDADAGTAFSQWQINSDVSGKFTIDPATGAVSLAAGQSVDFETATSHTISVSVWDGYVRSAPANVTINVTNANDNTPVIDGGADYRIDGGYGGELGTPKTSDADDTNEPGFTTFGSWAIVGGNEGSVFTIDSYSGDPYVSRPMAIDWSLTGYSILVTVSDGVNTSVPTALNVRIPAKVTMCVKGKQQQIAKAGAAAVLRSGGFLGLCKKPR